MCIIMHAISHVLSACILMSVPSYIMEYALCPHTMRACGTRIPKLKPAQTRGLLLSLGAGRRAGAARARARIISRFYSSDPGCVHAPAAYGIISHPAAPRKRTYLRIRT